jgi:adenosine/AMP kinase
MQLISVKIIAPLDTNLILGVIDGESPKGVENAKDREERRSFLRTIGYKR